MTDRTAGPGTPALPSKTAWSAWFLAAKLKLGSWSALQRRVVTTYRREHPTIEPQLPESKPGQKRSPARTTPEWLTSLWSTGGGGAFRNFWERGGPSATFPDDLLQTLVRVVTEQVPNPPSAAAGWTSFHALTEARRLDRANSPKARGAPRDSLSDLQLDGFPSPAGQSLTRSSLILGSWAFEGDLPPFAPRHEDAVLEEAVADSTTTTRLVVVKGPPKSGKTRSVVELLSRRYPNATVFWPKPGPHVLPLFTARIQRLALAEQARPRSAGRRTRAFVVLDDLQNFGSNPVTGVNKDLLQALTEVAQVIVMVHEHALESWQLRTLDKSFGADLQQGASPDLLQLLRESAVTFSAEWSPEETLPLAHLLSGRAQGAAIPPPSADNLRRLAEYLAAADLLTARARSATGYNRALVAAALDATHLHTTGIPDTKLRKLTRWHHGRTNPTAKWDRALYRLALEWASDSVGGEGSPHALLSYQIIGPEGEHAWRLMETLPTRVWSQRDGIRFP